MKAVYEVDPMIALFSMVTCSSRACTHLERPCREVHVILRGTPPALKPISVSTVLSQKICSHTER